jgi:hypothetical protein
MPLMTLLAAAQNGTYFAAAAAASGVAAAEAQAALSAMAPAIAEKLQAKAQADADAFEALLSLLDDGADSSELNDPDALTGAEAIADGAAVLKVLYGSSDAALAAMKALAPALPEPAVKTLAAIGTTSVLAALGQSHAAPQALADAPQAAAGGGLLKTILSALVAGAVQGAIKQLAPKRRRRRRSYSSYFGPRRRQGAPTLNEIFGQILGTNRR